MKVQFYSLTNVRDALAAVDAGADLLGLVVDAGGRVPEEISPEQARAIIAAVGDRVL
jgi:phosphoribosylanthranilate isomerase